jgi:hypothetical protein
LKACNRQQYARKSYDASCLALRDGALTGACYLQRDAAKLYAEAQAFMKLADGSMKPGGCKDIEPEG